MDRKTFSLLKDLTEATGLPGYEGEIRDIVRDRVAGLAEASTDNLGNIICTKRGTADAPRVMLPGHMDEIGFLVNGVTDQRDTCVRQFANFIISSLYLDAGEVRILTRVVTKIASAYSAGLHFDEGPALHDFGSWNFFNGNRKGFFQYRCFHTCSFS